MAAHTREPWTHYDDSASVNHRHEIVAFGKTVAHVYCTKGDEAEDAANAALIAAAPGLLEALKLVWDTYGFDPSIDSAIWQTVIAAIAHAEGKTP